MVDNLLVPRQPSPHLTGIYFISPSSESVRALVSDFATRKSELQYGTVHVYFSSPVDARHLEAIKGCHRLIGCLKTLKEVNLEYILYPDFRSFTTGQPNALNNFLGANMDSSDGYRSEIRLMATRLATVFSTLKEFPSIRYRAALPPGEEYPPGLDSRLLLAQRLAVTLHEILTQMQRAGAVPERETCELILTDRGFDPVAPVIHEWTYEAMIHDLLEGTPSLRGKVFVYSAETQGGKKETKEHVLDERDVMYTELRHRHFAAASIKISTALDELRSRSRVPGRANAMEGLDLKGISKLVRALPEFRDQLALVSTHVELASMLNGIIDLRHLTELGKLEQDLVYGDATSKEVIAFLTSNSMIPEIDKLRLLMCYSATHQEKLDNVRSSQWQKVAKLSARDMAIITNLEYLGIPVCKRQRSSMSIGNFTFGRRRRRAVRKDREVEEAEAQYALTRFVPMLTEVVEDAALGRLSQDEYPYVQPPGRIEPSLNQGTGFSRRTNSTKSYSSSSGMSSGVMSFRTIRSEQPLSQPISRKGTATMSPLEAGIEDTAAGRGGRIFAFVIGGFTFSELRAAHKLSSRLQRDVFLGGTSVHTPGTFLQQLSSLNGQAEAPAAFEIEKSPKVATPRFGKRF